MREAFKYLVDYDAIGETLIKGIGEIHQNFLPKGVLGALDDKPYKLDVAKAKELLAKAGLPDGFSVTMDVRNHAAGDRHRRIHPADVAAQAGIKMEIIPGDGKQIADQVPRAQPRHAISASGASIIGIRTPTPKPSPRTRTTPTIRMNKTLAWRNAWDVPD